MAVDLVGVPRMEEQMAIQEAASAGLKSMEHLIRLLNSSHQPDYSHLTDFTVSKFKQLINLLNRTGHARFRRAPNSQIQPSELKTKTTTSSAHLSVSSTTASSFMSSITGDRSVSDGMIGPSLLPPPSAAKPPLSSSHRKRCHDAAFSAKISSSSPHCHCSKRRKSRVKRTIRVPAISSKIADIPPDDYSWRKYGQKPIKGSPYPRGYYRCSTVRVCPARKHVERAQDDPNMLIVTYAGEHRHPLEFKSQIPPTTVEGRFCSKAESSKT